MQGTARAINFSLVVNGSERQFCVPRDTSLLQLLRNDCGLNGPKYGCGLGQCGACTVHVDGVAARACTMPAHGLKGHEVVTLEGLGSRQKPHLVQQAFIDAEGAQCGYCLNGMIMMVAALLLRNPDPDEARIRAELSGNLCRCGTHLEILQAALLAAQRMRAQLAAPDTYTDTANDTNLIPRSEDITCRLAVRREADEEGR